MNIFDIKKLKCSYNGGSVVLEVDRLSIVKGELVFVIGISGAGKSTLLETLGLMNNTITKGSVIDFSPSEDVWMQFDSIWDKNRNRDIFQVRQKHFSFIFQNTNLMPNFSVYENICLTQMIQGVSRIEAIKVAQKCMQSLGLNEVEQNKKPSELSGGQAQRVAFVRAITPEFSVLFGDEPTGNLDEKNSRDLMTVLKQKVLNDGKTAIIVSHNVNLALEFADKIILISKPNSYGLIKSENIFTKNNSTWISNNKEMNNKSMLSLLKKEMELN